MRVGMEATGFSRWFERLLAELGFELWIGDPAEIKAKRASATSQPFYVPDHKITVRRGNLNSTGSGKLQVRITGSPHPLESKLRTKLSEAYQTVRLPIQVRLAGSNPRTNREQNPPNTVHYRRPRRS